MSGFSHKEIKDVHDHTQFINIKRVIDSIPYKHIEIPDIGPIKYDTIDQLGRQYLELLPALAQRVQAVEQHVASGEGKPFIPANARPDVAGDAIREVVDGIRLLDQRLGQVETALAARSQTAKSAGK